MCKIFADREEFEISLSNFRRNLKKLKMHFYFTAIYVVYIRPIISLIIVTLLCLSDPKILNLNAAQYKVSCYAFLCFLLMIEAYKTLILISLMH